MRTTVVSGAPPVPKTVERSNATSACATWPSTSSRAPVAEKRTNGPRATFSATVSAPSVSVSATAAFVLLTSSESEPVTETPAGRFGRDDSAQLAGHARGRDEQRARAAGDPDAVRAGGQRERDVPRDDRGRGGAAGERRALDREVARSASGRAPSA